MMKKLTGIALLLAAAAVQAQNKMTPELLWKLGRVSGDKVTADQRNVIYTVGRYDLGTNKGERNLYSVSVAGGELKQLTDGPGTEVFVHEDVRTGKLFYLYKEQLWSMAKDGTGKTAVSEPGLSNVRLSPDGKYILFSREVELLKVRGSDRYPELPKAEAFVYDDLNYRHWDTWEDGKFQHIFYAPFHNGKVGPAVDIMKDEPYDCPQMPFGGSEDAIWSPDGRQIIYVCKKKFGNAYALSTNTDIYFYNLDTKSTTNFTGNIKGYDTFPSYSSSGNRIAWLSMDEDGYESDKNDVLVHDFKSSKSYNLTKDWDGTVDSYMWNNDGNKIYFLAVTKGTEQLFEISRVSTPEKVGLKDIRQLTKGKFDVNSIIGQAGNALIAGRSDMNHATELYRIDLKSGSFFPLTNVNKGIYDTLSLSRVEERHTRTSDGKDLLSWVIYPPNFDPSRKYPTLLYCQGGPQSALSQFYSFRWNFQLMAANGYIVVAPNRRGMPGYGVKWNEQISGDWAGQPMRDYLAAIDDISREAYIDKNRLGAVGASYGGYSVYYLAGIHENRFKTFIAHDGLFDLRSWYGTTEELWFANKDLGGPYWGPNPPDSYKKANPILNVEKWRTPIMIVQGGTDYRVPVEQGLEAFQAAQLKGIKSRLLYLPNENHWVLSPQNAILWQREFFRWLKETL